MKRHQLGSMTFDAASVGEWLELIAHSVANREKTLVTSKNIHSLAVARESAWIDKLGQLEGKVLHRIDGMPIVLALQLAGCGVRRSERVTWVDLMPQLWTRASKAGWRIGYLGSTYEAITNGSDRLNQEYGEVDVVGLDGYFDINSCKRNVEIVNLFNAANVDVLLVGMGMPRQEEWIARNWSELEAPVIMTAGAVINYFAGKEPLPPRWMGSYGLEWLFRLINDPRRLARRYTVEPLRVLPNLLTEAVSARLSKRWLANG